MVRLDRNSPTESKITLLMMEFGKFELATLGSEKKGDARKRGRNRLTDAGQQGATDSVRASFLFLFRPITVHILAQVGVSSFFVRHFTPLSNTHSLLPAQLLLESAQLVVFEGVRKVDHNEPGEVKTLPPNSRPTTLAHPRIAFCVSIKQARKEPRLTMDQAPKFTPRCA